jgi:predicted ester cyclase
MTHLIAEADKVVAYFVVSGTHRGELMGKPATGRRVSYEEVIVLRLRDGKIVEHWAVADALSLMQGIGAI